jgi:hypothetical protein
MTNQWIERAAADVTLDLSRLKGEPSGSDTRYSVALEGPVGEQWVEAYRTLEQAEPAAHRRFELDVPRATVRFSCRTVDGTGVVFDLLEQLETIVGRVNQVAAVRRAAGPRISLASPALRAR